MLTSRTYCRRGRHPVRDALSLSVACRFAGGPVGVTTARITPRQRGQATAEHDAQPASGRERDRCPSRPARPRHRRSRALQRASLCRSRRVAGWFMFPQCAFGRCVAPSGFLALCFAVAGIAGAVTASSVETWYPTLEKPAFTPPDRVFGRVWTALYAMMAPRWVVGRPGCPGPVPRPARAQPRLVDPRVVRTNGCKRPHSALFRPSPGCRRDSPEWQDWRTKGIRTLGPGWGPN